MAERLSRRASIAARVLIPLLGVAMLITVRLEGGWDKSRSVASSSGRPSPRPGEAVLGQALRLRRARALEQSRTMPMVAPADISGAGWSFAGPEPINNGQGLSFEGFCAGASRITASGRVTAIAFGAATSTIYLGAWGGGAWKTTDGGATWMPLTDQAPSTQVGALAVIPGASTNQDVVYVGTGKADAVCGSELGQGILKSSDGGQTWSQLAAVTFDGLAFTRIAPASNPAVVYASTEQPFIGSAAGVCRIPASANGGLYKTTDAGLTWAPLSGQGGLPGPGGDPGAATDVTIDPTNDAVVFVAVQGTPPNASGGVWKSTDAGSTWSQLAGGLPPGANRIALSISPDGTTLYAARADASSSFDSVYRSSDRGATWAKGGSLPPLAFCLPEVQPYYDLAVQMDPHSAGFATVYLGLRGIYGSTDGGTSWNYIGTGTHPDNHAIAVNASGVFLGNDGGISHSTDGGVTWDTSLNNGLGITEFAGISIPAAGTGTVFGGALHNGSNLYSGSPPWSHVDDGEGGHALIDSLVAMTFFGEQSSSRGQLSLRRSSSGALNSFMGVAPAPGDFVGRYAPFAQDPANGERILFGTDRIYESCSTSPSLSCNGATGLPVTWTAISGDLTNACMNSFCDLADIEIAPNNSAVVYAATASDGLTGPKMWVTANSTAAAPTFADITAGLPALVSINSIAVHPGVASTVLVGLSGQTGGGKHLFRSTNSGASWIDVSAGLPDTPVEKVIFDQNAPDATYYVGTELGVFRTTDAGTTWANFSTGTLPAVPVSDLRQNANMIAAATQGRGVWTIALAPTATATPSATPTPAPSATPTPSPTASATPTPTAVITPGGTLSLSTTSIAFPPTGIDAAAPTHDLAIRNVGKTPLFVNVDPGDLPSVFAVTGGGAFSLAPGRSRRVAIKFAPTSVQAFTGVIAIASGDPQHRSANVAVSGSGASGKLEVAATLKFGKVKVNAKKILSLPIRNGGPGALHGNVDASTLTGSAGSAGTAFSLVSGGGAFTLAPGKDRELKVQFAPPGKTDFTGTLTITSDDPKHSSIAVAVSGTGR